MIILVDYFHVPGVGGDAVGERLDVKVVFHIHRERVSERTIVQESMPGTFGVWSALGT